MSLLSSFHHPGLYLIVISKGFKLLEVGWFRPTPTRILMRPGAFFVYLFAFFPSVLQQLGNFWLIAGGSFPESSCIKWLF